MNPLETYLSRLCDDLLGFEPDGAIEPLARVSGAREDHMGLAVCTADGEVTAAGSEHAFPIQSISKAVAYAAAIDRHGKDHVVSEVDEEPTGEEFNAISIDKRTSRPKNPLVNIGAIRVHAMLGTDRAERTALLRRTLDAAAGRELELHEETLREELAGADRNRALAYMLRAAGSMGDDAEEVVAGYLEGCAVLATVRDLAVVAGTFAHAGVNPVTGERVFTALAARQAMSIMMTCGMYDNAGDWVSDVGLPAKSGVGGGIIAALPTRFGVAAYSPQLDAHGNSVRGVRAFERMTEDFGWHVMEGPHVPDLAERAAELIGDVR
ncbi:glutaminase A [Brachybacterium nesterenkovii]|uniref:glutaminase A n=1 Tax=Brachybacterium nesterenkovii TaxID=47847 RepID=UPI0032195ECE